jgi:AcrR family transcriptional regulator
MPLDIKYIDVLNAQMHIPAMAGRRPARRKGKPKGDKRARTRAALIEAAAAIIGEKGYERTSLEEVARAAGMSRGAIYGNFKSKEELLLAFVEARWKPVAPPLVRGAEARTQLCTIGKAVADAARECRAHIVGILSFQVFALTHEPMRRMLQRRNAEIYKHMKAGLEGRIDPAGLSMPLDHLIPVLHAMTDGMILAHCMQPEVFTESVIVDAFAALAK